MSPQTPQEMGRPIMQYVYELETKCNDRAAEIQTLKESLRDTEYELVKVGFLQPWGALVTGFLGGIGSTILFWWLSR